jgi:hemoglobin-like flavoprotein
MKMENLVVGQLVFQNLFMLNSDLLQLFSFANIEDFINSEKFLIHVTAVISTIGKIVENLESMDNLLQVLENIGREHIKRDVKQEDYEIFSQAIILTMEQVLEAKFNFELRNAWYILVQKIKDGCISDNYEELENITELYNLYDIPEADLEDVTNNWRKALKLSEFPLGYMIFKNAFKIYPELLLMFPFHSLPDHEIDEVVEEYAEVEIKKITICLATFKNIQALLRNCKKIKRACQDYEIHVGHHVVLREAVIITLQSVLKISFT